MAITRLIIDGYGQIELNNVAFRRDGRIEAQCALDKTDFASKPAENGMLLAVDEAAGTVRLPDASEACPIGLNYTSEHMYDERHNALKDFKLELKDGFYPRIGFLSVGDTFTTNCISYAGSDANGWAGEPAFIEALGGDLAATKIYGVPGVNGTVTLSTKPAASGLRFLVVKKTTMPDGQLGVKLQVIGA